MIEEVVYLWGKNTVFDRQLTSAHKYLKFQEGTVDVLQLPEHQNE